MTLIEKESRNTLIMLSFAALISVIFLCNFYFYSKITKVKKDLSEQEVVIESLKKENEILYKKLNYKEEDVKYLKGQNKSLDQMLEKQSKRKPKTKTINKDKDQKV